MRRTGWLTVFSVAMGYLEATVVVYLRQLYYPGGFRFPLVPMNPALAATEFGREAATVAMLAGVGVLFGKNRSERLAGFVFSFALWDMAYYAFLQLLLDWPESLFTWDILFLIPIPWVGPVLAPGLLSVTMIGLAWAIIHRQRQGRSVGLKRGEWLLLTGGSLIVISSFVEDYARYVWQQHKELWHLSSQTNLFAEASAYTPVSFNWLLFGSGECLLLWAIYRLASRRCVPPGVPKPPSDSQPNEQESFSDYLNPL